MYRIFLILLFVVLTLPSRAQGWYYSINIDYKTTSAMNAAYGTQYAMESNTESEIKKILDHYTTAELATAGIFASKWLDRKALTNAGRFSNAQRNYYYKRIYQLVSKQIMPRIFHIAVLSVKHPEKALYWGPYLYKTTEDVKQLCMQFEVVVCNGKISFQDIVFFSIKDDFKKLFDLAKLGDVDWSAVLDKMGEFGQNLTKEDFMQDLEGLMTAGAGIASAGGGVAADVWNNMKGSSKQAMSGKIRDIGTAFENFKDIYDLASNPNAVKNAVMEKLVSQDSLGVVQNLFTVDGYNIGRYLTDYLDDAKGQYYKQTYYIQNINTGTEVLLDYTPSDYGNPKKDYTKGGEYYYQPGATKADNFYEMCKQTSERWTGWSRSRVNELNNNQNEYTYNISESAFSGYWYRNNNKDDIIGYYGAASIYVTRYWYWKTIVYEETFDSYDQNISVFLAKMNAKLQEFNENQTTEYESRGTKINKDVDNPVVYELVAGPKIYYTESDERKMQGCESVSYTLHCNGETDLGEGSFQWKENGSHNHSDVREDSKNYAMQTTLGSGPDTKELDQIVSDKTAEKNSLESEINTLTDRNRELLRLINTSSINDAQQYREEYNSNQKRIDDLQQQLDAVNQRLNEARQAKEDMLADYADDTDEKCRIPSVMHQVQGAYNITWKDEGSWQGNTFVRKGTMPSANDNEVSFSAELSVVRGESHPWWALGIRTHRAILKVHWTLHTNYESSQVLEVMKFEGGLSDAEKSQRANQRLHELQREYPTCTVEMEYAFQNPQQSEGDTDEQHLLWVSDRLRIARNIEYRLAKINAELILVEKFLMQRESILSYLKNKIFDGLPSGTKKRFGGKAFRRWQHAAEQVAAGKKPEEIEILKDEDIEL